MTAAHGQENALDSHQELHGAGLGAAREKARPAEPPGLLRMWLYPEGEELLKGFPAGRETD